MNVLIMLFAENLLCNPYNKLKNSSALSSVDLCFDGSFKNKDFLYKRKSGRYFGSKDCFEDFYACDNYLVPFTHFNVCTGFYNRENLLRCNFSLIECYLNKVSCYFNEDNHHGVLISNFDDLCHEIYIIFKRCLYLIDFNCYHKYKCSFEAKRYQECFYIIYTSLKLTQRIPAYIRCLEYVEKNNFNSTLCFYQSKNNCIVNTNVEIGHKSKILSADFLYDPKSILQLNLYERLTLLSKFINRCYNRPNSNGNEKAAKVFFDIYSKVYLRGTPSDHHVTAFVLYRIFSELGFRRHDRFLIEKMAQWLENYYVGHNAKEARFFCLLTFGFCEK